MSAPRSPRRRWPTWRFDLLILTGVAFVGSQVVQHMFNPGIPADQTIVYGGTVLVGLGLGLRLDRGSHR